MNDAADRKRQAFTRTMGTMLNQSALNLAVAIGYRAGLFEAMDALDGPQPLAVIAGQAGLSPRYVREWLAAMVCGGVVELSEAAGEERYLLPREHADVLTRRAGSDNLGVYTQEIPILTQSVLDDVPAAMRSGQGIAYARYPAFQAFMGQLADAKHRQTLVQAFLPSVAAGEIVAKLRAGISVCDLGCSQGVALLLMAKAFPASSFVGIDISQTDLAVARADAERLGLGNATFLHQDAAAIDAGHPLAASMDYVTAFDAIHDQTRPVEALKGVLYLLKAGGIFSMVDIAASSRLSGNAEHPLGAFLYTVSLMHCLPVGLIDGGQGLGMMWGREKAEEMLHAAGFTHVEVAAIPDDAFNLHYFCRKG